MKRVLVLLTCIAAFLSCDLWETPDSKDGRSTVPDQELLVVHSLAETLSSVRLGPDGAFRGSSDDIVRLGSVPNGIVEVGNELAVTLSGENRILFLNPQRLTRRGGIDLGASVNPMQSTALGPGGSVLATSGFFTARVYLTARDGSRLIAPAELSTGPAPQPILALPEAASAVDGTGTVRLVTANTAYSSSRPSSIPFGPAGLSVFTLSIGGSADAPEVELLNSESIPLEAEGHNPDTQSGINPVALVDMNGIDAAINELLVIGSGINYGADGSGVDDGTVLVLQRDTLAVKQRIPIGGSPGAAVVMVRNDGGLVLLAAGTDGIRSLQRPAGAPSWNNEWDSAGVVTEYAATGGLPFLSDIVTLGDQVYVADFGNNQVLRFRFDGAAGAGAFLGEPLERRSVSDGPAVLLVRQN